MLVTKVTFHKKNHTPKCHASERLQQELEDLPSTSIGSRLNHATKSSKK